MTTALILNAILMAGVIGALTAVVRLPFRLLHGERLEALGAAEPIPAQLPADEERALARAA